jgi:hypothetical protein
VEGREATATSCTRTAAAKAAVARQLDLSDWVTRELRNSIDEFTARLQGGMAVLASVGSTAPFVGLFGTVWGIYHALMGIGVAGQATIDKVAGPIGEALIMTALGLAVAIPAVLGYNALVRGNKSVLHKLNRFAHDLHAYFVTGARVTRGGQPAGTGITSPGRGGLKTCPSLTRHGLRNPGRHRRGDERDQHDSADRRDAGAADHLHHHRAGDEARRQHRPAPRQQ